MPKSSTRVGSGVRFQEPEDETIINDEPKLTEIPPPSGRSFKDLILHLEEQKLKINEGLSHATPANINNDLYDVLTRCHDELTLVLKVLKLFFRENQTLRRKFSSDLELIKLLRFERRQAIEEYNTLELRNEDQAEIIERLAREKTVAIEKLSLSENSVQELEQSVSGFDLQIKHLNSENTKLTAELNQYKQETPDLKDKITDLMNQLQVANTRIHEKHGHLEETQAQLRKHEETMLLKKRQYFDEGYQKASKDKQRELDQLVAECDKHKNEILKVNQRADHTQLRVNTLLDDLQKLNHEFGLLKSEHKSKLRELDDLQNKYAASVHDLQRQKTINSELQADHKQTIQSYESKIMKLKQENETEIEKTAKVNKNYEVLSALRSEAETQLKRLDFDVQSLKASLHEREEQIVVWRAKFDASERAHNALKVSESSLQDSVQNLQKTVSYQTMRLQELDNVDVSRLQDRLSLLQSELQQTKQSEDQLRQEFVRQAAEWNAMHAQLKSEINELYKKLQSSQNELDLYKSMENNTDQQLRGQYEQLYNKRVNEIRVISELEINDKQREIDELVVSKDQLRETHKNTLKQLGSLQLKFDQISAELSQATPSQQQVPALIAEVNSLRIVNSELETQLQCSSSKSISLEEALQKRVSELEEQSKLRAEELKSSIKIAESQRDTLNARVLELQSQLNVKFNDKNLEQQIHIAEEQSAALLNANRLLKEELNKLNTDHKELIQHFIKLQSLVVKLRFIKALHDQYYPSLDQSIDAALGNRAQHRTLRGAFLAVLAAVKFRRAVNST